MVTEKIITRIEEKTLPSLCDFIERVSSTTTSEKELEVLPEVVESLSLLIKAIQ